MPRYIDADALIDFLDVGHLRHPSELCFSEIDVANLLLHAPTVSPDEVRGVVHCKDCKWCHAGYCEKYDDLIPWGCANKPWEDWFCADGKRREAIKEEQDAD